jgi:membrane-anchored protein YejM (alkaline phosphatase superfamily)
MIKDNQSTLLDVQKELKNVKSDLTIRIDNNDQAITEVKKDISKNNQEIKSLMQDVLQLKQGSVKVQNEVTTLMKTKGNESNKTKEKNFVHIRDLSMDHTGLPMMPDQRDSRLPS